MDPQVQASFIPKKPLTSGPRVPSSMAGLYYLAAIILFTASLLAAGAVFAYTQVLKSSIASKEHSLKLAKDAYEPASIEDLIRLDQRISNAKALLGNHIAVSGIFGLLSQETLQRVQFTSFSYKPAEGGGADIGLAGTADSFATVALQSDQFGASKLLSNVVFSNIVSGEGGVTFAVSATVNPSVLSYRTMIAGGEVTAPPVTNTSASSTASTTQNQ